MVRDRILSVINRGVDPQLRWKKEEILAVDFNDNNQRVIILMYQSRDFCLYLYDMNLEYGEWEIKHFIPLDWNFTKIGYSLFLSAEVEELIKEIV